MIEKRQYTARGEFKIPLGRRGENNVTEILFPQPESLMGNSWTLIHRRARDNSGYQVPLEKRGNALVWTIARGDVETPGIGRAELTCTGSDGAVLKSVIYTTLTVDSLDAGEDVPDPAKPWYEDIMEKLANAGTVKSVNGVKPDESGNVEIETGGFKTTTYYSNPVDTVVYVDSGAIDTVVTSTVAEAAVKSGLVFIQAVPSGDVEMVVGYTKDSNGAVWLVTKDNKWQTVNK